MRVSFRFPDSRDSESSADYSVDTAHAGFFSYFPAQKCELFVLIEPSSIRDPAACVRIGGSMNYVWGCCAIQGRMAGVILELGAV